MALTEAEKLNVQSIIANVVDEELGEDLTTGRMEVVFRMVISDFSGPESLGRYLETCVNQQPDPKFTRIAEKIYVQIQGNLQGFRESSNQ